MRLPRSGVCRQGTSIVYAAPEIEKVLTTSRADSLAQAVAKFSSASEIVDAMLSELSSSKDDAPAAPGADPAVTPSAKSIDDAIAGANSAPFRRICTAIQAYNLGTPAGVRNALMEGLDGQCMITTRVLLSSAEHGDAIAAKHAVLAHLSELRPSMADLFNHTLRLDPVSGSVRPALAGYFFSSASMGAASSSRQNTLADQQSESLRAIVKFDFLNPALTEAPHGLFGYLQFRDGRPTADSIPAVDLFCELDFLAEFGDYLHRLVQILGLPGNLPGAVVTANGPPPTEFTIPVLFEYYAVYARQALTLTTLQQQYEWIIDGDRNIRWALSLKMQRIIQTVYSKEPASKTLNKSFLSMEDEPLKNMKEKMDNIQTVRNFAAQFSFAFATASSAMTPGDPRHLPRLSKLASDGRLSKEFRAQHGAVFASPKKPSTKLSSKRKAGDDDPVGGGDPQAKNAGSHINSWVYLEKGKKLLTSGRVWDIYAITAHLKVKPGTKCWPYLLSECSDQNRMSRCAKWREASHADSKSEAHVVKGYPDGLPLKELAPKFSTPATREQKALLAEKVEQSASRGRGRGRGRGRDGRGRGRMRGGQGRYVWVENEQEEHDGDDDQSFRQPAAE